MGTKFCLFTLMKCNPIFEMSFSTGAIPEVLLSDGKKILESGVVNQI
jgi:hypothetical protein